MSEGQNHLAKPQTSLLFVHLGRSTQAGHTGRHDHPFWQLEIAIGGTFEYWTEHHKGTLAAGMQLLLPPGNRHAFDYPATPARWVTYKISLGDTAPATETAARGDTAPAVQNHGPWLFREHPTLGPLFGVLTSLAPAAARHEPQEEQLALSLLEAVCAYACAAAGDPTGGEQQRRRPSRESRSLRERVDAVLRQSAGRPTTVGQIAAAVGLSPGHLSNRFSEENAMPLKRHIDRARLSYARELLEHADLPISLIADELHFPDVYSFSRFVKRLSGHSPREIRAQSESV
ncbi:MAG: AraC family transcriptional regulator [Spirochaetota bacterium]